MGRTADSSPGRATKLAAMAALVDFEAPVDRASKGKDRCSAWRFAITVGTCDMAGWVKP